MVLLSCTQDSAATPATALDPVKVTEAITIRELLQRNSEELSGLLTAMSGGYVLPEAGGDLLRDGPGVLPTGGGGQEP